MPQRWQVVRAHLPLQNTRIIHQSSDPTQLLVYGFKKLDGILLGSNISGNGDRRQPYLGDPAYDIVCSGWVMPIINTNGIPFFGS